MYRCKVISDGSYCYALTVSVPEGAGTSYDTMLTEVFSSMELSNYAFFFYIFRTIR